MEEITNNAPNDHFGAADKFESANLHRQMCYNSYYNTSILFIFYVSKAEMMIYECCKFEAYDSLDKGAKDSFCSAQNCLQRRGAHFEYGL